jgi:RNA polymerase sigma-70 factor (ECF subfamily)
VETRSPKAAERTGGAHSSIFDALYHQYKSLVFDFAWRLTQDRGEAEDLFQETWLRVVENLPKINVRNFKAWAMTVTANLYRDALRKKRIRRFFLLQKSKGCADEGKRSFFENETSSSRDESECADAGRAIARAMAALPGKQRCVFVLKEIEGFKYSEIGEMLMIPLGTVKTLMHRAVKRLRQELSAYKENGCLFAGSIKNEMQRH